MAVRLPDNAAYPTLIPTTIAKVNKTLEEKELALRVKEILIGVRCHVTVIWDRVPDPSDDILATAEVLRAFKTDHESSHILQRRTHSILKFNTVPTVYPNGKLISAEVAEACLRQHPAWTDIKFLEAPRFVL